MNRTTNLQPAIFDLKSLTVEKHWRALVGNDYGSFNKKYIPFTSLFVMSTLTRKLPLGGPKKVLSVKNAIITLLRHDVISSDVTLMQPPCMVRVRTQSSQKHGHCSLKSSFFYEIPQLRHDVITSRRSFYWKLCSYLPPYVC